MGLLPLVGMAALAPLDWITAASGLVEEYPLATRIGLVLIVLLIVVTVLLVEMILHYNHYISDRSDFVEYDGAYLKKKKEGGLYRCVYCWSCYSSTAAEGRLDSEKFKCKCGWSSPFTQGDFAFNFAELTKEYE